LNGVNLVRGAAAVPVFAFVFAAVPVERAGAQALPYLPAGDARLRHEVQLQVDEGTMPLGTTWPISSLDVPKDDRESLRSTLQPGSGKDAGWFVNGAVKPTRLRTFDDTPRENGEVGLQSGWAVDDYAGGVFRFAYAFDPQDDKPIRLDDTYVAWRVGNWWATAGYQERWWGPGHDGSLILSNNARPMLQVGLDRAVARAPEWSWLKWIGPYRWSTFMGRQEKGQSGFPHPLFWGIRASARPFNGGLEIGLTRTAQWCRPNVCGFGAFKDVVLGRDNQGENIAANLEPGNQLAGYDFRWKVPGRVPAAIYYQGNGESIDNRNWRPRILTQLIGAETWGELSGGASWRAFVEFAGTACGEIGSSRGGPTFNCAYENGVFTGGYRRLGRVIGHSAERDARLYTLGGLYADTNGRTWELRLRKADLNRGAVGAALPSNTVLPVAGELWNAEAKVSGMLHGFSYDFGVGVDRLDRVDRTSTTVEGRAFLNVGRPW
jgi:hypothetical protein